MNSFEVLSLSEPVRGALKAMSYATPTEIQAKAIPVALTNRDVIGCAQTGTGKTAAFGVPIVENLMKSPRKRALVLAPTRELALQIDEVLRKLTRFTPELELAVLIGGASFGPQLKALARNPRIVVATPGRLLDHLRQGKLSLSATEILVLDEADRMLDMGFAPQLEQVLRYLPKARQSMLFSATFPNEVQKLVNRFTKDPVRISVGPISKPVEKIAQSVVQTTGSAKKETLLDTINACAGSVLVFTRTKSRADNVCRHLNRAGLKADRIHGDRSQNQRQRAIEGFRHGKFDILVATDIAARGIDIPHIANVINYDLPMVPEDYVHRIGRTGRAGADGRAVSLLTAEDSRTWRAITKLIGSRATAAPVVRQ